MQLENDIGKIIVSNIITEGIYQLLQRYAGIKTIKLFSGVSLK